MRLFTITLKPEVAGGCRRHSATHGEDESETLCWCQAAAHHSVTQHPGHEGPRFYHAATCADNPQFVQSNEIESDRIRCCRQFLAFIVKMV